jgi:hypothetical protein
MTIGIARNRVVQPSEPKETSVSILTRALEVAGLEVSIGGCEAAFITQASEVLLNKETVKDKGVKV